MSRRAQVSSWLVLVVCVGSVACRASGTTPFQRQTDDPGDEPGVVIDGGSVDPIEPPNAAPHALLAIEPPHGPFSGGTVARLRGNGFSSDVRVWFGDTELPSSDVIALSPQRIQVTVPPGEAGSVDVVAQNGDDTSTRVRFEDGFTYDAFYAEPSAGPTSGGTLITLHGSGTLWDGDTTVTVDRQPCEVVELVSPEQLVCRAPAGSAGSRPIRVTTADGVAVDVLDAFNYGNTDDGTRGGLSGNSLKGELQVLVFDNLSGSVIPNAAVIAGSDAPTVAQTDGSGVAVLQGKLGPRQTITVAQRCFQPVTFVDVPVDRLAVYLDPVLASTCFSPEGDIPRGGGNSGQGAGVQGELVWPERAEFRREGWTNVPAPRSPDEVHVAYVFPLAAQPTQAFNLPSAVSAVTPSSTGDFGFGFNVSMRPGNFTLYALAGIENRARSPYRFTAYSMGLIRGVSAPAGRTAENVFIRVDVPLDQELSLEVGALERTRRGPDRLEVNVAIRVGTEGYVVLPGARAETLLGGESDLSIVGLPALARSLTGTRYVAAARAVTGSTGGTPRSVLGLVGTTTTADALIIGPFVEVPQLTTPATNARWDAREITWTAAPGGLAPNLVIVDVTTGGGLYNWRIVGPGTAKSVMLPDLAAIDSDLAWPKGSQTFEVVLAHVTDFDYGSLRYRDLTERAWTAHAVDAFFAAH